MATMMNYKVRGRVIQGRIEITNCWKLVAKKPGLMATIIWSRVLRPFARFDLRLQAPDAATAKLEAAYRVRNYLD